VHSFEEFSMLVSSRASSKCFGLMLAVAAFLCVTATASAQILGGINGLGGGLAGLQGGLAGIQGGGGGGGQQAMIQRAINPLSNPINYWQYGQVTAVKPIFGTVRIHNEFGTFAQMQQGGLGQGGIGGQGGLGGLGGGGGGQGMSQPTPGDDPPQGVMLHVNYAQLFFPNQQQMNGQNQPQQGGLGALGGLGGIGGLGLGGLGGGRFGLPGGGKFQFGNGDNGL
jgi:hypothetical protein